MPENLDEFYAITIGPLGGARVAAKEFLGRLREADRALPDAAAMAEGAAGTLALLATHPAARDEPKAALLDPRWLAEDGAALGAEQRMDDALTAVAAGALAALRGADAKLDPTALLQAAFADDDASRLVRAGLLGRTAPPDRPDLPVPKGWEGLPDDVTRHFAAIERYAWYRELMDALRGLGAAAAEVAPPRPWQPGSIGSVASGHAGFPQRACPGDLITIRRSQGGPDFGTAQPADVFIVFKNQDGAGSGIGEVPAGGWTPDAVTVRVPAIEGRVCIGFVQGTESFGGSPGVAAANLVDVIARHSPTVAGWAAGAFKGFADPRPVARPGLQPVFCTPGVNEMEIGRPRIRRFEPTGAAVGGRLRPRQAFGLGWEVQNADRIVIRIEAVGTPAAGAPALPRPPAAPLAASGSAAFSPLDGLGSVRFRCTLEAENTPCGTATRSFEIDYAATVGLVFMGGGTRSAFDLGAIEYLSLGLPVRPTVFAGSGFGAVSAIFGGSDITRGQVNAGRALPQTSRLASFWEAVADWNAFDVNALPAPPSRTASIADMVDTMAEKILYTVGGTVVEMTTDQVKDLVKDTIKDALISSIGTAGKTVAGAFAIAIVVIVKAVDIVKKIAEAVAQENHKKVLAATIAARDPAALRALLAGGPSPLGLPPEVRIAVPLVDISTGDLLYADQGGVLRRFVPGANPFPTAGLILTAAQVLSAATVTPGRYPTLPTGGGTPRLLADGGLRDPVPIAAAVRDGADHLFVISPNGGALGAVAFPAGGPQFMQAAERGVEIRDFADARRAINPFEGWAEMQPFPVPVEFIEATVPLHEATLSDPGLVAIARDYGYMRAFDVHSPGTLLAGATARVALGDQLRALSDRIAALRLACWRIENQMEGMRLMGVAVRLRGEDGLVPIRDGIGVPDLRQMKRDIRAALIERATAVRDAYLLGGRRGWPPRCVPPGWEAWFEAFERHPFGVGTVRADPALGDPEDPNNRGVPSPWTSLIGFERPNVEGWGAEAMPDRAPVAALLAPPP